MTDALRQAYDLTQAGDLHGAEMALDRAAADGADRFSCLTVHAGMMMRRRQFDVALDIFDEARRHRPLDYTVHYNAALCLYELGRFEEAIAAHRRVLSINPSFAKAWMKLGACGLPLHRFAEALACQERAVGLDPGDAELRIAFGTTISLFGDDRGAQAQYREALRLNPAAFEAEISLGTSLLRSGDWAEAWPHFEARWNLRPFGALWDHKLRAPWFGKASDLRGKTVLLRSEQGYGDTIQFARYVPLVVKRASKVWLETEPSLASLMAGLGAEVLVRGRDPLPESDVRTNLMSLPGIFGTTPTYTPAPASYRVEKWDSPARVGLCWHGGERPYDPLANADDQRRSIPWEKFAPIADVVPCISLQQEDLPRCKDWADTAQVIRGLDLVITVDTAIAHLAGSLGVPTWLLTRFAGCWRWMTTGDTTPWYPTMRLYRQPVLMEWGPVIDQVVTDLKAWAHAR